MTQDSSIKNKTKAPFFTKEMLHNGRSVIRENLRLFIVLLVLHMVALPLILTIIMIQLYTVGEPEITLYAVIGALSTCGAVAAGLICALCAMPYLYKKSVVDMRLALPMTTGQRFVSDFLGGLFLYFGPLLISQAVTWILMLVGHITCDGKTFIIKYYDYYDSYSSFSSMPQNTFECHIFEESAPYLIKSVVGAVAIMLMFYSLTILVSACCGAIFESAAYSILANLLIPGVIVTLIYSFTAYVMGFDAMFYVYRIIPYCSPAGGVFGLVKSLENYAYPEDAEGSRLYTGLYFSKWLVIFLLVTALIIAASFLIYRKRKAEDTGKPVVFGIFYHILMALILVEINCGFLMSGDGGFNADMLFPQIVVTAIIYLIFHVVSNRGFAHFKRGVISYIITMAVTVGALVLVNSTQMFGAGNYIPSADSVSEVYTSYTGYFGEANSMNDSTIKNMSKITDTENIRTITKAHEMIKDLSNNSTVYITPYYNGDRFDVLYKMKSGRTILRKYPLYDDGRELLSTMDCTEEFKQIRIDDINRQINNSVTEYEHDTKYNAQYTNYASLYPQWAYNDSDYTSEISIDVNRLPGDFYEKLGENLAADIMAETEDDYFTRDGDIWFFKDTLGIDGVSGRGIPVKEHFTNTLDYLESVGFSPLPKVTGKTIDIMQKSHNCSIRLSDSTIDAKLSGRQNITSSVTYHSDRAAYSYNEQDINDYFTDTYLYKDEIVEMMSYAKKEYRSADSRYTIGVNGNYAVIPAKYTDKAKNLYIAVAAFNFGDRMYAEGDYYYDYYSGDIPLEEHPDSSGYIDGNYQKYIRAFIEVYSKDDLCNALGDETGTAVYESMTEYASRYAEE